MQKNRDLKAKRRFALQNMQLHKMPSPSFMVEKPGGALNFFQVGVHVRPGFPKCGASELTFASEKGGL